MISEDDFIRISRCLPFLEQADSRLVREFRESAILTRIPRGRDVFAVGERSQSIALLISGPVRVYTIGETGREITLYRFGQSASCVLTASAILTKRSFPAIATVEKDAEAVLVPVNAFRDWIRRYEGWCDFVFDMRIERLASVVAVVGEVTSHRGDRRVASFLIERGSGQNPLHIRHQEIVGELGSAREVISRTIEEFAADGPIRTERRNPNP